MSDNPLVRLSHAGQSPWLDFITRDLIESGELRRLIDEDGVKGMTTNPTIFEKAVGGGEGYDADIRALAARGLEPRDIFERIAIGDVQRACDVFRPLYDFSDGRDGLVSLEVSPEFASDAEGTIREARRLWGAVGRRNAMIKIPGTVDGLTAIERCLAYGINVNVTLLFSVERYEEVIEAYMAALERRVARRDPVDRLASVASFFVSRVDSKVDPQLDAIGSEAARALRGTIAIANAQVAYERFELAFRGPRWEALARKGARAQRPLWASTSTKDPTYSDLHYVEALVAPRTVNTIPPETLAAYRDHGNPRVRIHESLRAAKERLQALAALGIGLAAVTRELEGEGVAKFAASFAGAVNVVEAKAAVLGAAS